MALLCFNSPPTLSSSPPRLLSLSVSPASRLNVGLKPVDKQGKSWNGVMSFQAPFASARARAVIVKAVSEVDGMGEDSKEEEEDEAAVPIDRLPLESKEQQKTEQRMRMKLEKKVRLRRKRLLRKRKMRKKGRWPPSKMKKLKNV